MGADCGLRSRRRADIIIFGEHHAAAYAAANDLLVECYSRDPKRRPIHARAPEPLPFWGRGGGDGGGAADHRNSSSPLLLRAQRRSFGHGL